MKKLRSLDDAGRWGWFNHAFITYLPYFESRYTASIYLLLCDHENRKARFCYISNRKLARLAGCAMTTVHDCIRELVRFSMIDVVTGAGRGGVNIYRLLHLEPHPLAEVEVPPPLFAPAQGECAPAHGECAPAHGGVRPAAGGGAPSRTQNKMS